MQDKEEHGESCNCEDCKEVRLTEARIESDQEERYLEAMRERKQQEKEAYD